MGIEKQGSKPTGYIGKIIGRLMNKLHTTLYVKYFKNDLPPDNSIILDIGCGGGKFIKFLSDTNDSYKLFGLDHSPEMAELSKKVNRQAINKKQVTIIHGSVSEIPIENNKIDLATAFETVQFWPDIDKSFSEIARLLKNEGSFLIINRYPPEGSKWWRMAKIKNDKEYIAKLEKAGFSEVTIDLDYKKGWIFVKATK
ncbi:MAG: class I SAM-dependent methyltransferase [Bacteroidales bacterium]|nr:class I SAM-dependent methyltransferase [Bacteroidales bacterium]